MAIKRRTSRCAGRAHWEEQYQNLSPRHQGLLARLSLTSTIVLFQGRAEAEKVKLA